ncbi:hypothetical protein ACFL59_04830 [Planctomycetota bacterium]
MLRLLAPTLTPALLTLFVTIGGARGEQDSAWPCFHGPNRDNKSRETGLLQVWPEGGPPRLWTATGLGHGYSAVSVASDRIFTAGMTDKVT